jgi:hypothetical protein
LPALHDLQGKGRETITVMSGDGNETMHVRSALWDFELQTIFIFADISKGFDTNFTCAMTLSGVELEDPALVTHVPKHDTRINGFLIECQPPRNADRIFRWSQIPTNITIKSRNGIQTPELSVEEVNDKAAGRLAMCMAVLHTDLPMLHSWLHHHRAVGVQSFKMYYTDAPSLHITGVPTVRGVVPIYGGPVQLHDIPDVTWHYAGHSGHSQGFSQSLHQNDCLFRYRYEYDYLLFLDIDEFLVLNSSLRGAPFLDQVLSNMLEVNQAGALFCRWHYSKACTVGDDETHKAIKSGNHHFGFFDHRKRGPSPDCFYGKVALRPRFVKVMWVHKPWTYFDQVGHVKDIPVSSGFVQHLSSREREAHPGTINLTECQTLHQQTETFLAPAVFLK